MDFEGIKVEKINTGLQLTLEGEMYREIAQNWEDGEIRPFYSILKDFIKALEKTFLE